MIDVETLRKGPPEELVKYPPVFTAKDVRNVLIRDFEAARKVTEHITFIVNDRHEASEFHLIEMEAGRLGVVGNGEGKYPKGRLQRIAFEVARQFGINTDVTKRYRDHSGQIPAAIVDFPDGTTTETLSYPSQTTPGLNLLRRLHYYTDTHEPIKMSLLAQAFPKPFSAHFRRNS